MPSIQHTSRLLLLGDAFAEQFGQHLRAGDAVVQHVAHGRGEKVKIVKFRRRKHHRKEMGHRQWFTEIKITGIQA